MRTFYLDIHPFRCGIMFCIGVSDEQFKEHVLSLNNGKWAWDLISKMDIGVKPTHARMFCLPGGESIIRLHCLKSVHDHGRLIHEIMHAVLHCLRRKDTPVNEDTEEVLCYSVQSLYEQAIMEFRKPENKKPRR